MHRDDTPALVVAREELVAPGGVLCALRSIPGSRMFEIKEALRSYRARHPESAVFDASQGDGGDSLPGVPEELLDEAHRLQKERGTGYDKPFGTDMFRQAVVEDYWQLDAATGWGPSNVIACQGGRDALLKAYDAVLHLGHGRRGDFVVASRVPWLSYNWGPYAVGANVMLAPGREAEAWELSPDAIAACVAAASACDERKVALVVVTSPDNPTGRSLSLERQVAIGRTAMEAGVPFVLFDWIYHRVSEHAAHDVNRFLTAFEPSQRERIIILDGVTKSLGASNIRNAHLLASELVVGFIQSRASHGVIPSFYSQAVAVAAYRMGFARAARTIVEPTNASRTLLRRFLEDRGVRHILGDGYYAFLDMGPWLDRCGMADAAALGAYLAEHHGLAVVPGGFFSDFGRRWIRFSYALPPATTAQAAQRLWEGLQCL